MRALALGEKNCDGRSRRIGDHMVKLRDTNDGRRSQCWGHPTTSVFSCDPANGICEGKSKVSSDQMRFSRGRCARRRHDDGLCWWAAPARQRLPWRYLGPAPSSSSPKGPIQQHVGSTSLGV
ncbi:hypothetical protein IG631_15357 [Alternaria alternata]|nr:hypothetical protein IG631_15357 [Alternaria alternata]